MDVVTTSMLVVLVALVGLIMVPERAWQRIYAIWDGLTQRRGRS